MLESNVNKKCLKIYIITRNTIYFLKKTFHFLPIVYFKKYLFLLLNIAKTFSFLFY